MWELGSPAGWRCKGIQRCSHKVKLSQSLMRFRGSRKPWVFTRAWHKEPDKEAKKTRSFLWDWNSQASSLLNTSCLYLLSLFSIQRYLGFDSKQLRNKRHNVQRGCEVIAGIIARMKSSTWMSFRGLGSGCWLLQSIQYTLLLANFYCWLSETTNWMKESEIAGRGL